MISSGTGNSRNPDSASYLELSCTIKEVQFTAGQKRIGYHHASSVEQENINGLGAASEIFHVRQLLSECCPERVAQCL